MVGIPRFPFSCSSATTNLADRIIAMVGAARGGLRPLGSAEGALGHPPRQGRRLGDERAHRPAVRQPAAARRDGRPGHALRRRLADLPPPGADALIYTDSVEVDEQRYPLLVRERRLAAATPAGRGGCAAARPPGSRWSRASARSRSAYSLDGRLNPPRGVRGGHDADPCAAWVETADGHRVEAPPVASLEVAAGRAPDLASPPAAPATATRSSASPRACATTSSSTGSRASARERSMASCSTATPWTPPPPPSCADRAPLPANGWRAEAVRTTTARPRWKTPWR